MQNREVPLGNLPIFFSSRQRAEAGRSRPGVRGAGCGKRARSAERRRRGHGRRTRNAKRGTRKTWTRARNASDGKRGLGVQRTGHRRRGTSPRAWTAARLHTPARPRNNLLGPLTAGHPIRRDLSRLDARRQNQSAAGAPRPTCRAYESESRRCRRARRTCCCRAAPRPT